MCYNQRSNGVVVSKLPANRILIEGRSKMKEVFEEVKIETVVFDKEDVITESVPLPPIDIEDDF